MTSSPKPSRGRPRDPAIDDAVLAATRALLVEIGCDQLSMVAIADRAGVGRPALYRRWPSKTHLVFEAVFGWQDAPTPALEESGPIFTVVGEPSGPVITFTR